MLTVVGHSILVSFIKKFIILSISDLPYHLIAIYYFFYLSNLLSFLYCQLLAFVYIFIYHYLWFRDIIREFPKHSRIITGFYYILPNYIISEILLIASYFWLYFHYYLDFLSVILVFVIIISIANIILLHIISIYTVIFLDIIVVVVLILVLSIFFIMSLLLEFLYFNLIYNYYLYYCIFLTLISLHGLHVFIGVVIIFYYLPYQLYNHYILLNLVLVGHYYIVETIYLFYHFIGLLFIFISTL